MPLRSGEVIVAHESRPGGHVLFARWGSGPARHAPGGPTIAQVSNPRALETFLGRGGSSLTLRRMLEVVREMIRRLEAGDPVEADDVQAAIDFIREYADRSHHAKEEDLLFPAMGEAGFPPEGGPVAVMLDEHDEGRAYVTSMEEGLQ